MAALRSLMLRGARVRSLSGLKYSDRKGKGRVFWGYFNVEMVFFFLQVTNFKLLVLINSLA